MKMESLASNKYVGRYAGVTCSGSNDVAASEKLLQNTYDAVGRYSTKMALFQTDYNIFYNAERTAYGDFSKSGVGAQIDSATSSWKPILDVYTGTGNVQVNGLNCTALRRGVIAIENSLCYKVAGGLYIQTGLAFACAILLILTAICMCGSLIYTFKTHHAEARREKLAAQYQ